MAKTLYIDCFSGASGDMLLGALLDLGLPLDDLRRALGSLGVGGFRLDSERVLRSGISATHFLVLEDDGLAGRSTDAHAGGDRHEHGPGHDDDRAHGPDPGHGHAHDHGHDHGHDGHARGPDPGHAHDQGHTHHAGHQPHRSLAEIHHLIDHAALSGSGRQRAKDLFTRLAEAEAAIHQMPLDRIHLHEVGALDSIIDIVGLVFAFEWLGADRIVASPLNVGGGTVKTAHGVLPVPAPATLRLLAGAPIYSRGGEYELVTPTGALVVTAYAQSFGVMPAMTVRSIGYGAGTRDLAGSPNVLRMVIGEDDGTAARHEVVVIEFEIDDMNPQIFGVLMERLYAGGALEVFYTAVQMKKNRPGTLVTVVAPPPRRDELCGIVFRETTTIGVRYTVMERECLARETLTVSTPIGAVRFKIARRAGQVMNASPEFEDCARLAASSGLPVKEVQAAALQAYREHTQDDAAPGRTPGIEEE